MSGLGRGSRKRVQSPRLLHFTIARQAEVGAGLSGVCDGEVDEALRGLLTALARVVDGVGPIHEHVPGHGRGDSAIDIIGTCTSRPTPASARGVDATCTSSRYDRRSAPRQMRLSGGRRLSADVRTKSCIVPALFHNERFCPPPRDVSTIG